MSALPCPDFSRIKDDAPGSAGPVGQRLTAYCSFAAKLESLLPNKRIGHLTENVVMDKSEADHFSAKLSCHPVVCDSADLELINRPRLWWSRVDWTRIRYGPWTDPE